MQFCKVPTISERSRHSRRNQSLHLKLCLRPATYRPTLFGDFETFPSLTKKPPNASHPRPPIVVLRPHASSCCPCDSRHCRSGIIDQRVCRVRPGRTHRKAVGRHEEREGGQGGGTEEGSRQQEVRGKPTWWYRNLQASNIFTQQTISLSPAPRESGAPLSEVSDERDLG